ncbi:unnamed protein product, partial [Rotaria magnacalcarata]
VIGVTLAFAICWLPIHILELTKCGNSSYLNYLIDFYPKSLYSIRAFTHALAYFNSCLNPYLYAILNRNFCIDLADMIPSWMSCCKTIETNESENLSLTKKGLPTALNQNIILKHYHDHEEDKIDDHEHKLTTNDASCQVELFRKKVNII